MALNDFYTIDLTLPNTQRIYAKQADKGYEIRFRILRNGTNVVTDEVDSVTFRLSKPDGTIYYGDGTVGDGVVVIPVDGEGQMFAVDGHGIMDVTLYSGEAVHSTQNFAVDIQAAPGGEEIPSTSVYTELEEMVDSANGQIATVKNMAESAFPAISVTGDTVSFDDGAEDIPVESFVVHVDLLENYVVGDPWPEGITGITITQEGAEGEETRTIDIEFPPEAGALVRCDVDVTNGKLSVGYAVVDMDKDGITWTVDSYGLHMFRTPEYSEEDGVIPISINATDVPAVCSKYRISRSDFMYGDKAAYVGFLLDYLGNYYTSLNVRDSSYSTVEEFETALEGQKMCYAIKDIAEYDIQPKEVKTFLGENHISVNAGRIELTYKADNKTYVDNAVPSDEHILEIVKDYVDEVMPILSQDSDTGVLSIS